MAHCAALLVLSWLCWSVAEAARLKGGHARTVPESVREGNRGVGDDHGHVGSPGEAGSVMVPRSHVHDPNKAAKHQKFYWTDEQPGLWGDSFEKKCGGQRSPVSIDTGSLEASTSANQKLSDFVHYSPVGELTIANHDHTVQVDGKFGRLELPDGPYNVAQFHFHFPSEHEVDGKHAAGELHIVHQKEGAQGTDDLAVIGILLEEGSPSGGERAFFENLGFGGHLPEDGEEIAIAAEVDLGTFAEQLDGNFFHYHASMAEPFDANLTTPPCLETVHWYVLQGRAKITAQQVESFKAISPPRPDNRPLAPTTGVVDSKLAMGPEEFAKSGSSCCYRHVVVLHITVFIALVRPWT